MVSDRGQRQASALRGQYCRDRIGREHLLFTGDAQRLQADLALGELSLADDQCMTRATGIGTLHLGGELAAAAMHDHRMAEVAQPLGHLDCKTRRGLALVHHVGRRRRRLAGHDL